MLGSATLSALLLGLSSLRGSTAEKNMDWCKLVPEGTFPECQEGLHSAPTDAEAPTVIDPEFHFLGTAPLPLDKVLTAAGSFEGDILGYDPDLAESADLKQASKNFVSDEAKKWPKGIIPYKISPYFRPQDGASITNALGSFAAQTGSIQFVERTTEADYVYIGPGVGCQSYTGRQGGRQQLSLQIPGCKGDGIIHHELMHLIGFYHEQSRTDRDDFVEINWNNIAKGDHVQFQKYSAEEITAFGELYDFGSVLHYGQFYFAIDPKVYTIRPRPDKLPAGMTIDDMGQRVAMSRTDLIKAKLAYPKFDNICPTDEGWIKAGSKKCYYFSFLANNKVKRFIQARNYCRIHNAGPASEAPNGLKYIRSVMEAHSDALDPKELIWILNCKTLNGENKDVAFSECVSDTQPRHFVCYKRMDPNEAV